MIEHGNGSGLELKPSEYANLCQGERKEKKNSQSVFPRPVREANEKNGLLDSHVDVDIPPLFVLGRPDGEPPEHPRDVERHRRRAEVHAGADAAAPAEGAVAERPRILALLREPFRPELVGLREIGLVEVDYCPPGRGGELTVNISKKRETNVRRATVRLTAPQGCDDGAPLWYEHAFVHMIHRAGVGSAPEHGDRPPA